MAMMNSMTRVKWCAMGGNMDMSTNGGGDEGWVGRWTGARMGVDMRDGWEDGQAHEWGWI